VLEVRQTETLEMAGSCTEDEEELQISTHRFEMGAIREKKERKATGDMEKDSGR
jgi:hypothetical protein